MPGILNRLRTKKDWFTNRKDTYDLIEKAVLVKNDIRITRIWEDLRGNLNGQKQNRNRKSAGLDNILAVLRIAHATTSVLRNLLSLAGFKDPMGRQFNPKESFEKLKQVIANVKTGGENR